MASRYVLILVLLFTQSTLWAREWRINAKDVYLELEIDSGFSSVLNEGETPNLQGHFCLRQTKPPKKCLKLSPDDLSHYDVKFYYPNITNEVSSLTSISTLDDKHEFEFIAPTLSENDRPLFIAQIVNKGSKVNLHQKALIKIQKLKARLLARQTSWPIIGKKYVEKLIKVFEKIEARISTKIQGESALIAKRELPLQFQNKISESSSWINATEEWQVDAKVVLGNTFEGEQSWIDLAFTPFPSNDDEWKLQYYLNGMLLKTKQVADPSSLLHERIITPQLNPGEQEFKIVMSRRAKFWFFDVWAKTFEKNYNFFTLPDSKAPVAENILPIDRKIVSKNDPVISFNLKDDLGRIDFSSIAASIEANDGSSFDVKSKLDFFANGEVLVPSVHGNQDGSSFYTVSGTLSSMLEGIYNLKISGNDFANNIFEAISWDLIIDRTPPSVAALQDFPIITNNDVLILPVTVSDLTRIKLNVFVNGLPQLNRESPTGDLHEELEVGLVEGVNLITINVIDEAGNSSSLSLPPISLDTTPPQIASLSPANGDRVFKTVGFNISGKSTELLSAVYVNGNSVLIKGDGMSFEYTVSTFAEGIYEYDVLLVDLAGNSSSSHNSVDIIFSILNQNLVSIVPFGEGDKLIIKGAQGASRPGAEISADAGFFNSEEVLSNTDGSFEILLDYFTMVAIKGIDPSSNEEESFSLSFMADTTLSGVIKDINNKPLPGVVVRIVSSGQSAITDSAGTFRIIEPASGDQKIRIDPTKIPLEIIGQERSFYETAVSFNVGRTQLNVMYPIYLNPLMLDGSETLVSENSESIVTSPHAPGFELKIPAGKALFPTGIRSGEISVAEISSERLTIPTPDFAIPDTVYALEPSGLKFDEPVEVTLPNPNNFPKGMNVIIMSKNSLSGTWEVDGIGEVDESGASITTKPGMGITHFSDIYAAPVLPTLSYQGNDERPQASLGDGGVTAEIGLPSYKSLDQKQTPAFIYNSGWVNPTMLVKHLIKYNNKVVSKNDHNVWKVSSVKYAEDISSTTWPEVDSVEFSFESNNVESEKTRFMGVPNNSIITYGIDTSNFDSGVYPYFAHFNMQLAQMTVGTRKIRAEQRIRKWFSTKTVRKYWNEHFSYRTILDELIPQDIAGPLYVSNKSNSPFGKGWKLSGHQELLNVDGPRIALEEGNGEIKTFTIDNRLVTIYKDTANGIEAASLATLPELTYSTNTGVLKTLNISSSSTPTSKGSLAVFNARYRDYYVRGSMDNLKCFLKDAVLSVRPTGGNIIYGSNGTLLATDNMNGILSIGQFQTNYLVGGGTRSPSWSDMFGFQNMYPNGVDTGSTTQVSMNSCSSLPIISTGSLPKVGYSNGGFSTAQFNSPLDMLEVSANVFIVSDKGNNVLRKLDSNTGTVTTFAGNGTWLDNGDNGLAIQAGIYHPQGLATDGRGSIYLSSENGKIRKIDQNGVISFVSGKPISEGGVLADQSPLTDVAFDNPTGLAFDRINNALYVADTGRNRIVRLDFDTNRAETVTGSGICGEGDLNSVKALEAKLCNPTFIHLDQENNLVILDKGNKRIRKLTLTTSSTTELAYTSTGPDGEGLVKLSNGEFKRLYKDGSIAFFNAEGKLVRFKARNGKVLDYVYEQGLLKQIIDPSGQVTSLVYNGNGKLAHLTDPAGRQTQFSISPDGELLDVILPDNSAKSFNYNEKGLLSEQIDQVGAKTNFDYNSWGRVIRITYPDGGTKEFNNSEDRTIVTASGSHQNKEFSSIGGGSNDINLEIKDPKNSVTKVIPAENGNPAEVILGDGKSYKYEYDDMGRVVRTTTPDGNYTLFTYNINGDIIESYESSSGIKVEREFNDFGQVTLEKDSKGSIRRINYDQVTGYISSVQNTLGEIVSFSYNSLGQVIRKQNQLGKVVEYGFDIKGNLSTVSLDGVVTNFRRDIAGNVIQKSNTGGIAYTYEFDLMNRMISSTDPENRMITFSYTNRGQLLSSSDSLGNVTAYEYDLKGRLVKKVTADSGVYLMTYDLNDNLLTQKDPNGNISIFSYDQSDRLIQKQLSDNLISLDYDEHGNLVSIMDNKTSLSLSYEKVYGDFVVTSSKLSGRGDLSTYPEIAHYYDFDVSKNRIKLSTGHGDFGYAYNSENLLVGTQNHLGESFTYSRDSGSRLVSISSPSLTTDFNYGAANRLESIDYKKTGSSLTSFLYSHNDNGGIASLVSSSLSATYGYNDRQELTSRISGQGQETFSYDELGNRLSDIGGTYSYDQKKRRLIEDYRHLYAYDNNGNLLTKQEKGFVGNVTNYSYNSQNQMIKIEIFKNSTKIKTIAYFYDVLGRRIQKATQEHVSGNDMVRKFEFDGEELLAEYNESNEPLAIYTSSGIRTDSPLSVEYTSAGVSSGIVPIPGNYYFVKDSLGSVIEIRNSSGQLIQNYIYSSFGEIKKIFDQLGNDVSDDPSIEPHIAFAGREYDKESGLYFNRARYYDPSLGRFITQDPVEGEQGNPLTIVNKYIYSLNDPINRFDPTGRFSLKQAIGWTIAIAFPVPAFIIMNSTDLFESNFDFSQNDIALFNTGVIIAAAVAAGIATGGTAAPAASAWASGAAGAYVSASAAATIGAVVGFGAGVAVGATTGIIVGGAIGGSATLMQGKSFEEGMVPGAIIGGYSGAVGGGIGASIGFGLKESSALGGHIVNNWQMYAAPSLLLPVTQSFEVEYCSWLYCDKSI